jgi:hypothetical protein
MKIRIQMFAVAMLALAAVSAAQAQTVMNIQRPDCNGTMHDLFAELDAGNVVVLEFFMQGCAPCILSGKKLETMRSTLEASYPSRVKAYAIGYSDGYICASIASWVKANALTFIPMDSGAAMLKHYGGFGMPTVVICAGVNEHKILGKVYIGMSTNDVPTMRTDIANYLSQATTSVSEPQTTELARVYPNPATNVVSVDLTSSNGTTTIDVVDATGAIALSATTMSNVAAASIDVSMLPVGAYIMVVRDGTSKRRTRLNITR